MARVRPGEAANPAPPTVARVRLRFAKRGRLRFLSHRDIARAVERAVRRAGVPVAHSHGFSPHPRISWIGAAPTGTASEAEYFEIGLTREVDPETVRAALDAALPDGIDVLEAVAAEGPALADRIDAGRWRIELPGVEPAALRAAVAALLAREALVVERVVPSGRKEIDVRAAVVSAEVVEQSSAGGGAQDTPGGGGPQSTAGSGPRGTVAAGPGGPGRSGHPAGQPTRGSAGEGVCAILAVVVRQTTPAVRPDDVLGALDLVAGLKPPVPARATRMAQGLLDDRGRLADPLGPTGVSA